MSKRANSQKIQTSINFLQNSVINTSIIKSNSNSFRVNNIIHPLLPIGKEANAKIVNLKLLGFCALKGAFLLANYAVDFGQLYHYHSCN